MTRKNPLATQLERIEKQIERAKAARNTAGILALAGSLDEVQRAYASAAADAQAQLDSLASLALRMRTAGLEIALAKATAGANPPAE